MLAPPELRSVHPLGKSPVRHGWRHVTLAETGLIVTYLCDTYGKGCPRAGAGGRPAEPGGGSAGYIGCTMRRGSAMPPLLLRLIFTEIPKRTPALLRPIAKLITGQVDRSFVGPQLDLHLDYWEAALGHGGWFTGATFGAADIMMSFPVEAAAARLGLGAHRRKLRTFLQQIQGRPAYVQALARGGAYDLASA